MEKGSTDAIRNTTLDYCERMYKIWLSMYWLQHWYFHHYELNFWSKIENSLKIYILSFYQK